MKNNVLEKIPRFTMAFDENDNILGLRCDTNGELVYAVDVKRCLNNFIEKVEYDINHLKYKRCVAMAKWCGWQYEYFKEANYGKNVPTYRRMIDWSRKWENKWLALSEKFKHPYDPEVFLQDVSGQV